MLKSIQFVTKEIFVVCFFYHVGIEFSVHIAHVDLLILIKIKNYRKNFCSTIVYITHFEGVTSIQERTLLRWHMDQVWK